MNTKVGRNDPCTCGSGKKFKQCCMGKAFAKKPIKATWVNAPRRDSLLDRTFQQAIQQNTPFKPIESAPEVPPTKEE